MPKTKSKKTKKKTKKKSKCCKYAEEERYSKEAPYEPHITDLVRCGILQDLAAVDPKFRSFDEWVGEHDVLDSQYDRLETQVDPSLQDVRNFAVEFGVLPLGYPAIRLPERFGFVPSMLLYGPSGSGKTMIARSIASSCGARWFDLSPRIVCESGLCRSDKPQDDIMRLVHLTFHVAKYLKPSVIYIDEIDKIFEGGKGHTGPHPTFLLDALKKHVKHITKVSRVLVIGATSKPFLAKDLKAMKSLFTVDTENREVRHMCFIPWPDNRNRILLWRKFVAEALADFKIKSKTELDPVALENSGDIDIRLLAKCSEGYAAGNIRQAVFQTLNYRRLQKLMKLNKSFLAEEFLDHLSRTEYCYAEDHLNFQAFRKEMICREDALDKIAAKRKAAEEGGDEKPKNGKKNGKK